MSRSKNFISFAEHNPELVSEWHPTKNGDLTPNDVSYGSASKVWWMCDNGHEWEAVISSRNAGVGCPVCSGHKIVVGINDLATVRPDLAKQWHPTKNGNLKPTEVTIHNGNKAWWICEKGHEWNSKISNRANGNNCPICIGKKVLVGYNDLDTIMPSIAKEWHPILNGDLMPCNITCGSNKKVWWQCEKGHEWQTTVYHRTNGRRCPKCFGETKTSFPEQAIFFYLSQITTSHNRYMVDRFTEIDIYLPEYKIGIEYDGLYFHKGEIAEKREKNKNEKLQKLGIFLIRVKETKENVSIDFPNNIVYSNARYNSEELTNTINNVLKMISQKVGLEFAVEINVERDRASIYDQYIVSEKNRSLLVLQPDIAAQWHPTKNGKVLPQNISVSSNKKIWWMCEKGHEWQAQVKSRSNGSGCPYCAGVKAIPGVNDLATVNPELAKQWHPSKNGRITPADVLPQSNINFWWVCEKGHEWKTSISNRSRGNNCPTCSGHKMLIGYNDLATVRPDLAVQWHPTKNGNIKPTDVTCGAKKMIWWQCEKGHEWEAVVSSRNAGRGCPYCSNQKLLVGYNDLSTRNPILALQWHPIKNQGKTPKDVICTSNKKVWWLGNCGHEWEALISSRNMGRGCPYCASQKLLIGFNDLLTVNPTLAKEWHPSKNGNKKPEDYMANSNERVWWLCKEGHEWENAINIRNRGHSCPYCVNQMVLAGYNDLATLNPELAKQWHPMKNGDKKPEHFTPGSNKKAWWICEKGHEWEAVISSRNKGAGCQQCYNLRRSNNNK